MIKIEVFRNGSDHPYRASFPTEDQALTFIEARKDTHSFRELEDHQLPKDCNPDLHAALYPLCEHNMLAELCAGPQHYPYDDDELRAMGYWAAR